MKKAAEKMKNKIENSNLLKPKPDIISNVTGKNENDINTIKNLLIEQITARVRWRESVSFMISNGVSNFIEIGPGKVLSSLVKKISKDVKITNINSLENISS